MTIEPLCRLPKNEDIQALSKRFLVSEDKLAQKFKELGSEGLSDYITRREKKYADMNWDRAKKDLEEIVKYYEVSRCPQNKGELKPKSFPNYEAGGYGEENTCVPPGLTLDRLKKIILKANSALLNVSKEDRGAVLSLKVHLETWNILAARDNSESLRIIKWTGAIDLSAKHCEFIAKGTFGIVQKAVDISKAVIQVLKLARNDIEVSEDAADCILNEVEKLRMIHKNGTVEGIQPPPSIVVVNREMGLYVYPQPYYPMGSIWDSVDKGEFETFSQIQLLEIVSKIVSAVQWLHDSKNFDGDFILHGDLKGSNILLEKNQKNEIVPLLADFGGSRLMVKELYICRNDPDNWTGTALSEGFFTKTDLDKLSYAKTNEAYHTAQLKREYFALYATAWEILANKEPYWLVKSNKYSVEICNTNFDPENFCDVSENYSDDLAATMISGLTENPNERPDLDVFSRAITNTLDNLKKQNSVN